MVCVEQPGREGEQPPWREGGREGGREEQGMREGREGEGEGEKEEKGMRIGREGGRKGEREGRRREGKDDRRRDKIETATKQKGRRPAA